MAGDFYEESKFYKSCESATVDEIITIKAYFQQGGAPVKGREAMLAISGEPQKAPVKWAIFKKLTNDKGFANWQFRVKDLGLDLTGFKEIFLDIEIEPYGPIAMDDISISSGD